MYVCVCNAVTESDIRLAVERGVHNLKQLTRTTGCSGSCGRCIDIASESLQLALAEKRSMQDMLPVM